MKKNNIDMIFLDMDGVLVDALQGMCDLFEVSLEEFLEAQLPKGDYDVARTFVKCAPERFGTDKDTTGIKWSRVYEHLTHMDSKWWENLPRTSSCHHLIGLLETYVPTSDKLQILTSPMGGPSSASGKMFWACNKLGFGMDRVVITSEKHLLARSDRVLIDDWDLNVKKFREHGGKAILFPNHLNALYKLADEPIHYVREQLNAIEMGEDNVEEDNTTDAG